MTRHKTPRFDADFHVRRIIEAALENSRPLAEARPGQRRHRATGLPKWAYDLRADAGTPGPHAEEYGVLAYAAQSLLGANDVAETDLVAHLLGRLQPLPGLVQHPESHLDELVAHLATDVGFCLGGPTHLLDVFALRLPRLMRDLMRHGVSSPGLQLIQSLAAAGRAALPESTSVRVAARLGLDPALASAAQELVDLVNTPSETSLADIARFSRRVYAQSATDPQQAEGFRTLCAVAEVVHDVLLRNEALSPVVGSNDVSGQGRSSSERAGADERGGAAHASRGWATAGGASHSTMQEGKAFDSRALNSRTAGLLDVLRFGGSTEPARIRRHVGHALLGGPELLEITTCVLSTHIAALPEGDARLSLQVVSRIAAEGVAATQRPEPAPVLPRPVTSLRAYARRKGADGRPSPPPGGPRPPSNSPSHPPVA